MKKFFNDFKAFIMKGNIIDMAVGVVIGGAFGKIVTSLVNDIITPLISILTGKVSLTEIKWVITEASADGATPELALTYGVFLQNVLDFLIIALSIFVVLRIMTTAHKKFEELTKKKEEEEKKEEAPKETELTVLCEIREMLKAQSGADEEKKED